MVSCVTGGQRLQRLVRGGTLGAGWRRSAVHMITRGAVQLSLASLSVCSGQSMGACASLHRRARICSNVHQRVCTLASAALIMATSCSSAHCLCTPTHPLIVPTAAAARRHRPQRGLRSSPSLRPALNPRACPGRPGHARRPRPPPLTAPVSTLHHSWVRLGPSRRCNILAHRWDL